MKNLCFIRKIYQKKFVDLIEVNNFVNLRLFRIFYILLLKN